MTTEHAATRLVVHAGHLCVVLDRHTRGAGGELPHEPGCGLDPIATVAEVRAVLDRDTGTHRGWHQLTEQEGGPPNERFTGHGPLGDTVLPLPAGHCLCGHLIGNHRRGGGQCGHRACGCRTVRS